MKSFFSEKRGQKLGCVLYTGAHYTQVNTVTQKLTNKSICKVIQLQYAWSNPTIHHISIMKTVTQNICTNL